LETVQDRDIVAMADYSDIVCGLSNDSIANALEGHFLLFELP